MQDHTTDRVPEPDARLEEPPTPSTGESLDAHPSRRFGKEAGLYAHNHLVFHDECLWAYKERLREIREAKEAGRGRGAAVGAAV